MRSLVLVALLVFSAAPAFAQEAEMDRAERELRDTMAPSASAGASVERVSPTEVRVRMPSDITFDFNRANVRYEFTPQIRQLAQTLSRYPGMSVTIIGHADAIGSDDYNLRLSERRARSVADALTDYGVRHRRIDTDGMGEFEPIATNASEWGRAQNRRVEIRVAQTSVK